ncbi:periplasmic heavy metal sensor [Edwardsiella ictaluri]|uniref:Spy/CpxP family protein refolding chaperone n=1 Tax=Edwardsiella ictaluri TaxID=67780 RepID=UPI0009BC9E73|nr:Spy/CpxP family protein refolding chaperone [Edwardsiella ictaluri]ARD38358.1 universal stress protein [Edwardsiella ictaluri]QPW26776.1 periplasmic heavy metal sensor [Edwardsiella ictaluri]
MRKLTVMALAASLALGVGAAWAQPPQDDDTPPCWQDGGMMMGSGYHHMMWRAGHHGRYRGGMFDGLTLSDAQRQQMRDIARQYAAQSDSAAWHDAFKQRQQIITGDKFDENAVRAQLDASGAKRNQQLVQRLKMDHQMYNVLTPEQKKAFNDSAERGLQQMQQYHDRGMHQ